MIALASKPTVRVRKLMDSWCVQQLVVVGDHEVWGLVAAYTTWAVAFAVALVEASPDTWPFGIEERTY